MGRSPFPAPPAPPASQPAPGMSGPAPGSIPAPPRPGVQPGRGREPAERRTLVVGRGISVQGTVTDAERLVVEGTFEASMIHATELVIAQGGVFKGEVEVEDTEIAGTIDGTLTARGNLVVRATGKVLGTARCRRLQVEDGGQITGRIEMITEPAPAPPRADGDRAAAEHGTDAGLNSWNKGNAMLLRRSLIGSALAVPLARAARAAPPPQAAQAPTFFRYRVGDLQVTAINDGMAYRGLDGFIPMRRPRR